MRYVELVDGKWYKIIYEVVGTTKHYSAIYIGDYIKPNHNHEMVTVKYGDCINVNYFGRINPNI